MGVEQGSECAGAGYGEELLHAGPTLYEGHWPAEASSGRLMPKMTAWLRPRSA